MDVEKLIEQLENLEACAYGYHINGEVLGMDCSDFEQLMVDAAEEISKVSTLQAENEKLKVMLEQVKQCIEIVETQRDAAIKELGNYMVQDTSSGDAPCKMCAKPSGIPCRYCRWPVV